MSFVVLDTDVASGSFLGRLPRQLQARLAAHTPTITFVTLGELTKWTVVRSWGPRRRASLEVWRQRTVLLPFSDQVAITWGELQARAQQRGRARPVNDTWIAACCLVHRLPLATFNTKDFADFAEYDGLELLDGRQPDPRQRGAARVAKHRLIMTTEASGGGQRGARAHRAWSHSWSETPATRDSRDRGATSTDCKTAGRRV